MRLTRVAALFLLSAAAAVGTSPAPASPADDSIRLPKAIVVPTPMPPAPSVDPNGVVTLSGEELYVIDSSVDVVIKTHPRGLIKFEKKKPGTYYARFAGGGGKIEEKEFAGPFVWVGKATGKGTVSLSVYPKAGVKDENEIVEATVEVDAGLGPTPPTPPAPGPTPGPGPAPGPNPKPPEPKPPTPEPVKSFRVILVYESGDTLTAAQNAVLYGKAVEDYLTGRCTGGKAGWGRRDKDTDPATDTTGLKDLWAAVKPKVTGTPALAIAVNDKVVLEPFPGTAAEAVALLKKYAGDK
jgi:hypothetical protein